MEKENTTESIPFFGTVPLFFPFGSSRTIPIHSPEQNLSSN
jgi:hypothetical protein